MLMQIGRFISISLLNRWHSGGLTRKDTFESKREKTGFSVNKIEMSEDDWLKII